MARKEKFGKEIIFVNHKRKKFSKKEREYIFNRDEYICQICHKNLKNLPKERILDHIVPLSKFGTNEFTNIWLLCSECDSDKKSKIIPDAINSRIEELCKKYKYCKK
jgi:5-methylcytosine-specific restriction endonuclease McrA